MLAGRTNFGIKGLGVLSQFENQRAQFDGFRSCPDNDEDFFQSFFRVDYWLEGSEQAARHNKAIAVP